MKTQEILRLVVDDELNIKEYLKALLRRLWDEGENFSGKRPFGDSGWEYDLYATLIRAGAVEGTLDDDGYVDRFDDSEIKKANKIIFDCIDSL